MRPASGSDRPYESGSILPTAEVELPKANPALRPGDGGIPPWLRGRWVVLAVSAGAAVLLFFAYLTQARELPIYGDGSAQALQAWDMLHGNVLLHGWTLSDVSFYTTELPQYMLIELVRGLNADVVHVAAAMTYTLLILATAWLAKGRATGREALVRVLIPVGIMLAPPLGNVIQARTTSPAWVLLSAPDHTGTQLPLLLTWLVLDRVRPRWWVPVVVAALLTWTQVADSTALYEGALPIVLVCGLRIYRRRGPLTRRWYDLSLSVGAFASVGVAMVATTLIRSHGGFSVHPAAPVFASVSGMTTNFWPKVESVLVLFGADFFSLSATHAVIPLAHLVAVVLVAWAGARAARRFFAEDDLVLQVLTASFVVLLAVFVFGYRSAPREAVGLLPIGAVLAGRLLAVRVIRGGLVPALAAVLACYGLLLAYNMRQPAVSNPDQRLASWLEAHHQKYGLSASWLADTGVTLYSQNRVQVADMAKSPGGVLTRSSWNTKASWYNARRHNASFLIWHCDPCSAASTSTFFRAEGRPARAYAVDGYTVFVWHKNLLAGPFAVRPTGTRR
jgi:hypothetical protein